MSTVNDELSKLSDWFRANKLSLNIKKTNYIMFGNKKLSQSSNPFQIKIDDSIIERVQSTKFFGLFIDERLQWSVHINAVCLSVSKALGVLGRVKNIAV